ncbi:MAG: hypothetical protein E7166_00915 [Firmicutes bacterium]|nr:hypothetical protein [Bacillota bacterium]
MQYSEEFKQKVLLAVGDSKEMKKLLDEGKEIVGRILEDARLVGVSAKEIVSACESMNLQGVYQKAKKQLAIEELYEEWKNKKCYKQDNPGIHR